MNRWVWVFICLIVAGLLLLCGWLLPAHLRAVDVNVLHRAGSGSPALVDIGISFVEKGRLGSAQLLLDTAEQLKIEGRERLQSSVARLAKQHPNWRTWGGGDAPLETLFQTSTTTNSGPEPFTDFIIGLANREKAFQLLAVPGQPLIRELLATRSLTNTTLFPPSRSSAGQAFDASIALAGLLVATGHLNHGLSNSLFTVTYQANRGSSSQPLENALMDFLSLGQRFNWQQLAELSEKIEDPQTLHTLTGFARRAEMKLSLLFSVVVCSGHGAPVAQYLTNYSRSGLNDLAEALRYGDGGVNELLTRNQRLYRSSVKQRLIAYDPFGGFFFSMLDFCWHTPWAALSVKWLLYLAGGFILAMGAHLARPAVPLMELPLQVRGFHYAREILFALGFLLVVLLLSEPFLAQESQKMQVPFRLRLSTVGNAVPAVSQAIKSSFMNPPVLLTLLLFFVLQALLYTACVVKLAEIRRQRVPARIRLRLLENEDHLFDAGLYLGFVGTIISLILVSVGVIKPSLMAAYSSTSFGIIFVSFFKIFHLRPLRRKLVLESENMGTERISAPAGAPAVTPT